MFDTQAPDPVFRPANEDDVPRLIELGDRYFAESELAKHVSFSRANAELSFGNLVRHPSYRHFVFTPKGEIEGYVGYNLDVTFTIEPLAQLMMLYVAPGYRKTPAGRCLLRLALADAKANGAKVFYAGTMSGVPGVTKTLRNLFKKLGFTEADFWGKTIL